MAIALRLVGTALLIFNGIGCRSLSSHDEGRASMLATNQEGSTCQLSQPISFVSKQYSGRLLLMKATGPDDAIGEGPTDLSLELSPSDLSNAKSLLCKGDTCELSVVKPLKVSYELPFALPAKIVLKYEVARDPGGAVVSRRVSIGARSEQVSIGRVLGVDIEVGAYLKQNPQKGFAAFSAGDYAETKARIPFLHVAGSIVTEGLKFNKIQVTGSGSTNFSRNPADRLKSTSTGPLSKDAAALKAAFTKNVSPSDRSNPDFSWEKLVTTCSP